MRILLLLIAALLLSGCSLWAKPDPEPVVITRTVTPQVYQPPMPSPLQLEDVNWFVITRDNFEDKIAEVERFTGNQFVVFAVTPKAYENMAWNFQEVRRHTLQLQEMIRYYQSVTENPAGATYRDWLEFNRQQQEAESE